MSDTGALVLTIVAVFGVVFGGIGIMLWLAHRDEDHKED